MADIPPHLLDRAKSRRAALSGGTVEAPATSAAPATVEGVDAAAAVPASSGAVAAAPKVAPAKSGAAKSGAARSGAAVGQEKAPQPPKGTMFAKVGSVALLVGLPVWALFMFNTWGTPRANAADPATVGASLYTANCVACHGADGGGGVGKQLSKGEVLKTFPDPITQMEFVKHGSCAKDSNYGDPKREGGQQVSKGGMPAWTTFTDEEIAAIITYERTVLQGKSFPATTAEMFNLADGSVNPNAPADMASFTIDTTTVCAS